MSRVAHTQVQNEALVLVTLHVFVFNQFSNFNTALCKSSPPSMEETFPPNLVSPANWLKHLLVLHASHSQKH